MNTTERENIAAKADMIVCGYAFSRTEDHFIRVINLNAPFHALVMTKKGETMETNMDDIEYCRSYACSRKRSPFD